MIRFEVRCTTGTSIEGDLNQEQSTCWGKADDNECYRVLAPELTRWICSLPYTKHAIYDHVTVWFDIDMMRFEDYDILCLVEAFNAINTTPEWFKEVFMKLIKRRMKQNNGKLNFWLRGALKRIRGVDEFRDKITAQLVKAELNV